MSIILQTHKDYTKLLVLKKQKNKNWIVTCALLTIIGLDTKILSISNMHLTHNYDKTTYPFTSVTVIIIIVMNGQTSHSEKQIIIPFCALLATGFFYFAWNESGVGPYHEGKQSFE